jgi:hypothetical protein
MDRIPHAFEIITPATQEPLSLDEAKAQCRVVGGDEDALITRYISAVREKVEADSERAFVNQTRRIWYDQFPNAGARAHRTLNPFPAQPWMYGGAMQALEIPLKPVTAITMIEYIDPSGAWQTWNTANYITDIVSCPARVTPGFGMIYPITRVQINAIRVTFTCGVTSPAQVPNMAVQAMLLLIAHWYENREAVGNVGPEIEHSYTALINGIRWH